jgi:hypothetical protein
MRWNLLTTRRSLFKGFFSLLAFAPIGWAKALAQSRSLARTDTSTLEVVAEAALPSALGREGARATVSEFLKWLENYREGVEMSPGYGRPRTRLTPGLDVRAYVSQLSAFREAMARHEGQSESESLATRRELIQASMEEAGIESFPDRPDGRHVVADLLSFYLRSSEARDLCYDAKIGRYSCPGLSHLSEKPAPLGRG